MNKAFSNLIFFTYLIIFAQISLTNSNFTFKATSISKGLMLFLTFLTQNNFNLIKSNSLRFFRKKTESGFECYAPDEYINVEPIREIFDELKQKECRKFQLKYFFMKNKSFDVNKLQTCLNMFQHLDIFNYTIPLLEPVNSPIPANPSPAYMKNNTQGNYGNLPYANSTVNSNADSRDKKKGNLLSRNSRMKNEISQNDENKNNKNSKNYKNHQIRKTENKGNKENKEINKPKKIKKTLPKTIPVTNVITFPKRCQKKNRYHRIYNYRGKALSSEKDPLDLYLNSGKFDGRLVLRNNTYKYQPGLFKKQGFIVSTVSPVGSLNDTLDDSVFQKKCGNYRTNVLTKGNPYDCFLHNIKVNGSYLKDNNHLSLYKNIQKHNITNVIMLSTPFDIKNDNNKTMSDKCNCKINVDKYYPYNNETFVIKNPDHKTNSDFVVKGKRNNKIKDHILNLNIFRNFSKTDIEREKKLLTVRELSFENKHSKEKGYKINHVHLKGWADFTSPQPEDTEGKVIMKLIKYAKEKIDNGENVLVHCTGGVGRTGEFITAVLTTGLDTTKNLDFFDFIMELRKYRPYFVELIGQLNFIRKNMELSRIK